MLKILDLFSGIGGFALGAEIANSLINIPLLQTEQFVEINPYCKAVLAKNYPKVTTHADIRCYSPTNPNQFDIVVGGSPCQDLSVAGKKRGITGDRSSLWFEQLRVFQESRATFLVWENVAGAIGNGFDAVLGSLAAIGCDAEWQIISAESVGAPHLRERIFLVAYPSSLKFSTEPSPWTEQIRWQVEAASTYSYCTFSERNRSAIREAKEQPFPVGNSDDLTYAFECGWQESSTMLSETRNTCWSSTVAPASGVAHGFPNRLDRIASLGNAIVPHCAAVAMLRVIYLWSLAYSPT